MIIEKEIHNEIIEQSPLVPPETGGILGGSEHVICSYRFDRPGENCAQNSYRPDIAYLNEAIKQWADRGIEFYGIFHSHSSGETTPSLPDIGYMHRIMEYIPTNIKKLYFPLVFPRDKMLIYTAARIGSGIAITEDTLVLL